MRTFLDEHAPKRPPSSSESDADAELGDVASAKRFQAALFDAGLAGLTWPEPWGQGLTSEHTRVFNEETAGRNLPTTRSAWGW